MAEIGFSDIGAEMFELASELWPLNRSITGEGVRKTLGVISDQIDSLQIHELESGSTAFDWEIPNEWVVRDAYIVTPTGEKICAYSSNNLHLVGYSCPFKGSLTLRELQDHLYSLPEQPEAIPYVTSYYERRWGFCISEEERENLQPGQYEVVVDTELVNGSLTFADLLIKGESEREVIFTTYVCHPSMANNELSGPVLAVALAKYLQGRDNFFSYRFCFLPETIGALAYLSDNLEALKSAAIAGFVLTCVGDDRCYSYIPSRKGDTPSDRLALEVAANKNISLKKYSWLDRGSDERQFCAPGIDLPFCSITRSKYGEYPEYHTSLDQLGSVVTKEGLAGSFDFYREIIELAESKRFPRATVLGEPQLGRRNLYPNLSFQGRLEASSRLLVDILSYADGLTTVEEITELVNRSSDQVLGALETLHREGLISY